MNALKLFSALALAFLLNACATTYTDRDKTWKGAGIGAAAGAVLGAVVGEGEADKILAGAAIGAGVGAGIGAYMDAQEEKLAQIPGTTVERVDADKLLVHFDNELLFTIDSAHLSEDSRSALAGFQDVISEFDKTAVVIQGHTDSTGSERHNLDLSIRRAEAVSEYLAYQGVNNDRVIAIGYGETAPRATNESDIGRSLNRRVSVLLKGKAQ